MRRRYIAVVFGLALVLIGYMDRTNIGVAAIQITQQFNFSVFQIGVISTVFFIGYSILQIPGGVWSERFGPRKVVTAAFSAWSVFTLLTAAAFNYISFIIIRTLFGFGEGPLFPGVSNLFGRWLRKDEFTTGWGIAILGIPLGGLVGTYIASEIMYAYGWQWIFIIFGIVGIILAIGYWAIIRDMPEESRFIPKEEIDYIKSSFANPDERGKTIKEYAPWSRLIRSGRFWAWGFTHAALNFPLYSFLTFLPLYLQQVRGFTKSSLALASSMPWAFLLVACILAGYFMDRAIRNGATLFKAHALPDSISFFLSGIFIIVGAFTPSPLLAVIFLSFGLAFMGPELSLSFAITPRMAGKFSGSYSGWLNTIANVVGAIVPIITGYIVSLYGWIPALIFVAAGAFMGGILWLVVQPDKSFVPELIPSYVPVKKQKYTTSEVEKA